MRTVANSHSAERILRVPPHDDPAMYRHPPAPPLALDKRHENLATAADTSVHTKKPSTTSTTTDNNTYIDDDDDLELPIVTTKPLSPTSSIAKFHRPHHHHHHLHHHPDHINTDSKPRRTSSSATAAARRHRQRQQHQQSPTNTNTNTSSTPTTNANSITNTNANDSSPPTTTTTNPTSTPTKPRRARSKYPHTQPTAKQLHRHNKLSSLVLHSVTPREPMAFAASHGATTNAINSFPGSFTEYEIVVENVRSSQIWQVSRRFATFAFFKKELKALFDKPHCHFCTEMNHKLDLLHDDFPRKRLWGSNKTHVVTQRARKLQVYLQGLMELGVKAHTKGCKHVASSFAMHLRSFLTVESVRFQGIPGGDFGHSIPSLLQELSNVSAAATHTAAAYHMMARAKQGQASAAPGGRGGGKRLPLATIQEHGDLYGFAAFLEADDDTEDEEGEEEEEEETADTREENNQRQEDEDEEDAEDAMKPEKKAELFQKD